MKALIVDDEAHVREAIDLSVDWAKYGIEERLMAEDGVQAMELIRLHKPAVLFCDMRMPNMDGTELLRMLREENEETQVIAVSGHDDFQYARAVIQAWGVDYLLKPFRRSDLEQALERASAAWRHWESSKIESIETEYRMKQVDALLNEQRLAAYLKGEVPYQEGMRSLISKLSASDAGLWAALVLPRNRIGLVNGRYDGDAELFHFAVNNIAHEVLRPHGSYSFCRLDPYQWVLLIAEEEGSGASLDAERRMDELTEAWRRTLGLSVFIGMTGERAPIDRLPAAVEAARGSLLRTPVYGGGREEEPILPMPRLSDQQLLLEAALSGGNKAYAADLIRGFIEAIRARGSVSLKELQACTMEANLLLERAGASRPTGKSMHELSLPLWISDLAEWERLLVQQWWRLIEEAGGETEVGGTRVVQAMRDYMDAHYGEDISLSSLSERFHFSPQYIAKKFKEVYNTTVVTYLTELRMNKAKSLLAHTGMTALEISELLGYADENYFGKVFKKHTGQSPVQYRKQEQQQRKGASS